MYMKCVNVLDAPYLDIDSCEEGCEDIKCLIIIQMQHDVDDGSCIPIVLM